MIEIKPLDTLNTPRECASQRAKVRDSMIGGRSIR